MPWIVTWKFTGYPDFCGERVYEDYDEAKLYLHVLSVFEDAYGANIEEQFDDCTVELGRFSDLD